MEGNGGFEIFHVVLRGECKSAGFRGGGGVKSPQSDAKLTHGSVDFFLSKIIARLI